MFEEYFAAGKFKTKCNYEWIPELRNSITLLMFEDKHSADKWTWRVSTGTIWGKKSLNYTAKKLPRKESLLWQMECNNPSALDYLTDSFLWWWMVFLEVLDTVKKSVVIYVNWQLPLITWELVLYCLAQNLHKLERQLGPHICKTWKANMDFTLTFTGLASHLISELL